jgi:PhnB protein
MTKPIPDGYHTVTPYLMVKQGDEAIEFYRKVFGATDIMTLHDPDGNLAHAQIRIGDSPVMLAQENAEWGNLAPTSIKGTPVFLYLYVEDVDDVVEKALAAGAQLRKPVSNQFYGDRSGRIEDPFGHIWVISTRKEDLTPEEIESRFEEFVKQQGAP